MFRDSNFENINSNDVELLQNTIIANIDPVKINADPVSIPTDDEKKISYLHDVGEDKINILSRTIGEQKQRIYELKRDLEIEKTNLAKVNYLHLPINTTNNV